MLDISLEFSSKLACVSHPIFRHLLTFCVYRFSTSAWYKLIEARLGQAWMMIFPCPIPAMVLLGYNSSVVR